MQKEAFRSGDKARFRESKYVFSKAVRDAKQDSEKLQHQFSANDSASVWRGLRLVPHEDAYGKTHTQTQSQSQKRLPSTRNRRIVSVHTRQLRLVPTAGKAAVHMQSLYVAL